MTAVVIELEKIELDPTTQPRVSISMDLVDEYAEDMRSGIEFPPIDVVWDRDSETYWLWDGFHRVLAAKQVGQLWLMAHVAVGTREDAQWRAFGANAAHGLRRSREDKRRAVTGALKHPKGSGKSDRQIARHCGVDHRTVNRIRAELESSGEIPHIETRTVRRGDQAYEMDVSNIRRDARRSPVKEGRQAQVPKAAPVSKDLETEAHPLLSSAPAALEHSRDPERDTGEGHRRRAESAPGSEDAVPQVLATDEERRARVASGSPTPVPLGGGNRSTSLVCGDNESNGPYTASEIVEAMKTCLDEIDLDPCAGRHSGARIPARLSIGRDEDGLAHEWNGRVGLTPPYGHMIRYWTSKLCQEYDSGRTIAAVAIVPVRTDEDWWKEIASCARALCFLDSEYRRVESEYSATQPLVAFYLGQHPHAFHRSFSPLGEVWERVEVPVTVET